MKTTDPAALKALAEMASGTAVIYLPDEPKPYPLAWAGEHRGKAAFFASDTPHEIPADLDVVATPVGLGYYRAGVLEYYVTPAVEAPEIKTGAAMDAIEEMREAFDFPAILANF